MNNVEKPTGLINDTDTPNPTDGHTLSIATLAVFVVLLVAVDIFLMKNASEYLGIQAQCIVIQEIKGKNYTLNTCTGERQMLNIKTVAYKK